MIPAHERQAYFLWREWILGEVRYRGKGPRSSPRPNVGYGDARRGQKPVPPLWWRELEAFLARRNDRHETPLKPTKPAQSTTPAKAGQLSEHFHVREFACKDGRHVPAVAMPALKRLIRDVLEPLRGEFGRCTVMSAYRPADYNRRIGGAQFSQHIYELTPESVATDLIFATGRPRDWHRFADRLGVGGLGLYSSFIHTDNRPGEARWVG